MFPSLVCCREEFTYEDQALTDSAELKIDQQVGAVCRWGGLQVGAVCRWGRSACGPPQCSVCSQCVLMCAGVPCPRRGVLQGGPHWEWAVWQCAQNDTPEAALSHCCQGVCGGGDGCVRVWGVCGGELVHEGGHV